MPYKDILKRKEYARKYHHTHKVILNEHSRKYGKTHKKEISENKKKYNFSFVDI